MPLAAKAMPTSLSKSPIDEAESGDKRCRQCVILMSNTASAADAVASQLARCHGLVLGQFLHIDNIEPARVKCLRGDITHELLLA